MAAIEVTADSAWRPRIWHRSLAHYPERTRRTAYLAIAIGTTMVLYYELYVTGGVATLQLEHFHMSFAYYTFFIALSNVLGAFGALAAGLCDRFGRANFVVYGLLLTGLLVTVAIPHAPDKTALAVETCLVGIVEGTVLVATPALIRDFSPQVGRATAMGMWVLGPVFASLAVSLVATNTLPVLHTWQSQYYICGGIGLLTFAIGFLWLRELSPPLRDQIMVTERDRVLVEARAKGIDVAESLRHPWRQAARFRLVAPALAFAFAFTMYGTLAGFGTIYFTTVFGFSLSEANGVAAWGWLADAVLCIGLGLLSDRLRIRKPFIMIAGILMEVAIGLFIVMTGGHQSFAVVALAMGFLAGTLGAIASTWLAAFTETIEDINPAVTATSLAISGWMTRLFAGIAFIILPHVVTSVDTHAALATAASQWRLWFWVCLAAGFLIIPLTLLMKGRWSPAAARRDAQAHERMITERIMELRHEREEV